MKNHRELRVHREKHHSSVLSVDSVVDFSRDEHFLKNAVSKSEITSSL